MRKKVLPILLCFALVVSFMPTMSFAATTAISAPAKVAAVISGKTSIKVSWSKVSNASKYEIWQSTGKKYTKVKTTKSTSYLAKRLSKNKIYKFKIKSIKKNGKKSLYSYSVSSVNRQAKKNNVTTIKLNRTKALLTAGETSSLKATLSPKTNLVSKNIVWTTSKKSVATVKNGVIKAVAPGKATITARAHNGKRAYVNVTVLADSVAAKDIYKMTGYINSSEAYAYKIANTLSYDMDLADDATGFRTAGSEAEHATADYLVKEFKQLGLEDVDKVPISIDKWQFNDASIKVKSKGSSFNITNEDGQVISYACPGTKQIGGAWDDLEIVDMGKGTKADYDAYYAKTGSRNMSGKVVLVALDQWNTFWISLPYLEAVKQKAKAIITYQYDGYAGLNDDAINVQDLCASKEDLPLLSISRNSAKKITKAIEADDNTTVDLNVDNEVLDGEGTAYNVVGKIPGKSHDQQIILAAHYDKYFYGFQDDGIAIGMIMAMAKTMLASGYTPENDIVVVAHAAEEWAQFDTEYDWACGSWQMIKHERPEWQGKTLAVINYELPAIDIGKPQGVFKSSAEFGKTGKDYMKSGLLSTITPFYSNGWKIQNDDQGTLTDCISYATNGVPFIMPRQDDRSQWTTDRYHTQYDDKSTYSKNLFKYDLIFYSGLAAYIDKNPAVLYDFQARCDYLLSGVDDDTESLLGEAKVSDYNDALAKMKTAAIAFDKKGSEINKKYYKAVKSGASSSELAEIRKEGAEYNKLALEIFAKIQNDLIGLYGSSSTSIHHQGYQSEVMALDSLIRGLSDGSVTKKETQLAQEINGGSDWYYWYFSDDVVSDFVMNISSSKRSSDNWGANETIDPLDTRAATTEMMRLFAEGKTDSSDYEDVITSYKTLRSQAYGKLKSFFTSETEAIENISTMLK